MPVHLGAMPLSVRAAIDARRRWSPATSSMLNDPFRGGTHLPDITLVSPVFLGRETPAGVLRRQPRASLRRRRHEPGLDAAGARDLPGRADHPAGAAGAARRDRRRRAGDRSSPTCGRRTSARATSRRRLPPTASPSGGCARSSRRYGARTRGRVRRRAAGLHRARAARGDRGRSRTASTPSRIALDDDGFGDGSDRDPRRACAIAGDGAIVDFTGSDPQATGGVNANFAITLSASLYAFRCLVARGRALQRRRRPRRSTVIAPAGTIVNAVRPAAVAGGNVETSQRITDVVLGALGAGAAGPACRPPARAR